MDGGEADEDEGHCRDEDTAGGREVIRIGKAIVRRRRGMTCTGRINESPRRTMSEGGKASVGHPDILIASTRAKPGIAIPTTTTKTVEVEDAAAVMLSR